MHAIERILNISAEARTHTMNDMLAKRYRQSLGERLGKITLGKCLATLYPKSLEDFELIGGGCEQIVYGSDTIIKKIIASSITTRSSEARRDSSLRQRAHQTFHEHLDRHLLETKYSPTKVRKGLYATVAEQPRLYGFRSLGNPEKANWHCNIEVDELKTLYNSIRLLFSRTEYYPDIIGEGNVVVMGSELKVIDTVPVSPSMQKRFPHGHSETIGQLIEARLTAWGDYIIESCSS